MGARKLALPAVPMATGNMPAPMAMVVIRIGRARLEQASTSASKRGSLCSRLAITAYSTSRMEFLVTMPISISKPISAGIDNS